MRQITMYWLITCCYACSDAPIATIPVADGSADTTIIMPDAGAIDASPETAAPCTPSGSFDTIPSGTITSGTGDLTFTTTCTPHDIVFQLWSAEHGVEGVHADDTPPYVWPNAALTNAVPGPKSCQALIRTKNSNGTYHLVETVAFDCTIGAVLPGNAVCGNGTIESGEQCDDGNLVLNDGCSSTCAAETHIGSVADLGSLPSAFASLQWPTPPSDPNPLQITGDHPGLTIDQDDTEVYIGPNANVGPIAIATGVSRVKIHGPGNVQNILFHHASSLDECQQDVLIDGIVIPYAGATSAISAACVRRLAVVHTRAASQRYGLWIGNGNFDPAHNSHDVIIARNHWHGCQDGLNSSVANCETTIRVVSGTRVAVVGNVLDTGPAHDMHDGKYATLRFHASSSVGLAKDNLMLKAGFFSYSYGNNGHLQQLWIDRNVIYKSAGAALHINDAEEIPFVHAHGNTTHGVTSSWQTSQAGWDFQNNTVIGPEPTSLPTPDWLPISQVPY